MRFLCYITIFIPLKYDLFSDRTVIKIRVNSCFGIPAITIRENRSMIIIDVANICTFCRFTITAIFSYVFSNQFVIPVINIFRHNLTCINIVAFMYDSNNYGF